MAVRPKIAPDRELAAYWGWWREAGVEGDFSDEPQALLRLVEEDALDAGNASDAQSRGPEAPEAEPVSIGGTAEAWPRELAAFREWWLAEPSLDLPGSGPRLPPRGAENAALLVLVPMPEPGDRERLLEGREGALITAMLAAMGIAPAEAYIAAALPRHMAAPDWAGLEASGLGAITRHHLMLARPQRLLVLGHAILPLLGHDPSQSPAAVRDTAIKAAPGAASVPTLASFAPGRLLENARQRAILWRRWLDWTNQD